MKDYKTGRLIGFCDSNGVSIPLWRVLLLAKKKLEDVQVRIVCDGDLLAFRAYHPLRVSVVSYRDKTFLIETDSAFYKLKREIPVLWGSIEDYYFGISSKEDNDSFIVDKAEDIWKIFSAIGEDDTNVTLYFGPDGKPVNRIISVKMLKKNWLRVRTADYTDYDISLD